jgi:hypothetical protein
MLLVKAEQMLMMKMLPKRSRLMSFDCVVSMPTIPVPMLINTPPLPMMNWRRWRRIGRWRHPQRNSTTGPGCAALGERRARRRNGDTNSKHRRNKLLMHRMNSRTAAANARYLNHVI